MAVHSGRVTLDLRDARIHAKALAARVPYGALRSSIWRIAGRQGILQRGGIAPTFRA